MSGPFWIDTTLDGEIVGWSENGPPALGFSSRHLAGRSLITMFICDRPSPSTLDHVVLGHPVERSGQFRPKDRRAVPITYRIERVSDSRDGQPVLRWTFRP
jgi:hypothetical protein